MQDLVRDTLWSGSFYVNTRDPEIKGVQMTRTVLLSTHATDEETRKEYIAGSYEVPEEMSESFANRAILAGVASEVDEASLDEMKKSELEEVAQASGVDVPPKATKDDIKKAIKTSGDSAPTPPTGGDEKKEDK